MLESTNADQLDPLNSAAVNTNIKFPDVSVFDFSDDAIGLECSNTKVVAKLSAVRVVVVLVMFDTGTVIVPSPATNETSYTALYNAGFNERIGSQVLPPGFTIY